MSVLETCGIELKENLKMNFSMLFLSNRESYTTVLILNRVASHAKKHLEVAKEAGAELPPNAFRAFLHCVIIFFNRALL